MRKCCDSWLSKAWFIAWFAMVFAFFLFMGVHPMITVHGMSVLGMDVIFGTLEMMLIIWVGFTVSSCKKRGSA